MRSKTQPKRKIILDEKANNLISSFHERAPLKPHLRLNPNHFSRKERKLVIFLATNAFSHISSTFRTECVCFYDHHDAWLIGYGRWSCFMLSVRNPEAFDLRTGGSTAFFLNPGWTGSFKLSHNHRTERRLIFAVELLKCGWQIQRST